MLLLASHNSLSELLTGRAKCWTETSTAVVSHASFCGGSSQRRIHAFSAFQVDIGLNFALLSREQPPSRQIRTIGLDSTTFDSNRYIDQLLGTTRLPSLLQKHLEMSAEIKSLDSDMQMLVYENYNKFISATDTIRTMKSSVDDMDDKMQTLQQLIGQGPSSHPSNQVQ